MTTNGESRLVSLGYAAAAFAFGWLVMYFGTWALVLYVLIRPSRGRIGGTSAMDRQAARGDFLNDHQGEIKVALAIIALVAGFALAVPVYRSVRLKGLRHD